MRHVTQNFHLGLSDSKASAFTSHTFTHLFIKTIVCVCICLYTNTNEKKCGRLRVRLVTGVPSGDMGLQDFQILHTFLIIFFFNANGELL